MLSYHFLGYLHMSPMHLYFLTPFIHGTTHTCIYYALLPEFLLDISKGVPEA